MTILLAYNILAVFVLWGGEILSSTTARLVWHTAYIVLFHSPDRIPGGDEYKEYALIRLDGENREAGDLVSNKTIVNMSDDFMGWDAWKEGGAYV